MHQSADWQAHDIVKITLNGLYPNDTDPLLDGIGACLVVGLIMVYIVNDLLLR